MTELSAVNSYVSRAWTTCRAVGSDGFKEVVEQGPGVVGAGRRFGMVLHAKDGLGTMPQAFDGPVVEIHVGHLQLRCARNVLSGPRDRKPVIL